MRQYGQRSICILCTLKVVDKLWVLRPGLQNFWAVSYFVNLLIKYFLVKFVCVVGHLAGFNSAQLVKVIVRSRFLDQWISLEDGELSVKFFLFISCKEGCVLVKLRGLPVWLIFLLFSLHDHDITKL